MRAVVQRVNKASVSVGSEMVSSIGRGLCVLVGLAKEDTAEDVDYLVRKLLNLRIFEGGEGKRWNKSTKDLDLEILCISQFTLHATFKGNKLDFHRAMGPPQDAAAFYQTFLRKLGEQYNPDRIKDGRFGAMMTVSIENEGPVTVTIDSKAKGE